MGTTTAAKLILKAMQELRARKITAPEYRVRMGEISSRMSEADFNVAKFRAAANDR